jgi:hypothetical protein
MIEREERCYRCGGPATTDEGTIYVRRQVDGTWTSVAICRPCWDSEHAERVPHRVTP